MATRNPQGKRPGPAANKWGNTIGNLFRGIPGNDTKWGLKHIAKTAYGPVKKTKK